MRTGAFSYAVDAIPRIEFLWKPRERCLAVFSTTITVSTDQASNHLSDYLALRCPAKAFEKSNGLQSFGFELQIGLWQELIMPEGPIKKFEFKKGGENFWQEH